MIVQNGQYPILHCMICLSKPYVDREDRMDNAINNGVELISEELSDTQPRLGFFQADSRDRSFFISSRGRT